MLEGCAGIKKTGNQKTPDQANWSGRLALHVQADSGISPAQDQSFSAPFELRGSARQGDLLFYTPLGSTAAAIHWTENTAVLQARGETREFGDLNQLIRDLLGCDVPVTALFSWLNGQPQEAIGWQVDLSQQSQGKILARRLTPGPPALLQVLLDN